MKGVDDTASSDAVLQEIAEIRDLLRKRSERKSGSQSLWLSSPVLVTFFSALFGLLGVGVGALIQGKSAVELEQRRFEGVLILDALKPNDEKERRRRLIFLVDSGLVERLNKKGIEQRAREPEALPHYQEPTQEDLINLAGAAPPGFTGDLFSIRLSDLPVSSRKNMEQELRSIFEKMIGSELPTSFFEENSRLTVGELYSLVYEKGAGEPR